jgi:hypothetical protein
VIPLAAVIAFGAAAAVPARDCQAPAEVRDCNQNGVPDECDVTAAGFGLARAGFSELGSPSGIAAADLDGNGSVDIAVALRASREVVFLSNEGQGGFPDARYAPLSEEPLALAAADLDGDGDTDVATASAAGVEVLSNDGRGGLTPRVDIAIHQGPRDIRTADVDGDADVDILTLNDLAGAPAGNVSVILNEGAAGFALPRHHAAGPNPGGIAVADLDGDRDLDAAIVSHTEHGIRILLNRGDGAFPAGPVLVFDGGLFSIAAGDLDGNGHTDLAVFSLDGTVNTFLGDDNGSFAFATRTDLHAGFPVGLLVPGDLDGDGSLDLAVPGQHAVLLNDGAARFRSHGLRDALVLHLPAALADLDGDGALDVASLEQRGVALLLNRPVATSDDCDRNGIPDECQVDCDCNGFPDSCDIAAGRAGDCDADGIADACEPDCNGNGIPDDCDIAEGRSLDANTNGFPDECEIALTDCDSSGIPDGADVLAGAPDCNGNGVPDACDVAETFGFLGHQQVGLPGAQAGVTADSDGDGLLDLVVSASSGAWALHGTREGRLARPRWLGESSGPLAAGDLDGDGDLDVAVSAGHGRPCFEQYEDPRLPLRLEVLVQEDRGTFRPATVHTFEQAIASLEAGDLTGDGRPDFVVSTERGVHLLQALGGAAFGEPTHVSNRSGPLITADFDGDGDRDIAVARGWQGVILFNDGSGTFAAAERFRGEGKAAAADLDGDGDTDIVAQGIVNLNDGRGVFRDGSILNRDSHALALGDASADGRLDVFLLGEHGISLHLNDGEGRFAAVEPIPVLDRASAEIVAGDFDGDALADIAAIAPWHGITLLVNLGVPTSFGRRVLRDDSLEDFHRIGALDADGDRDQDIAVASGTTLRLYTNRGDGRLDGPVTKDEADFLAAIAVADLDGDGDGDVALGSASEPRVLVRWNEPGGLLETAGTVPVLERVSGLATFDMDGDGDLDTAAASETTRAISIVENEGGRRFSQPVPVLLEAATAWIIAADMDGDGDPDILTGHDPFSADPSGLTFVENDGQGGFSPRGVIRFSHPPHAGAAADLDSDSDTDIVLTIGVLEPSCGCILGNVVILFNLGGGKLLEKVAHESLFSQRSILATDLDRDGDADIAFPLNAEEGGDAVYYGDAIAVLLNDGGGAFGPPHEVSVGRAPGSMVAADLDGDGLLDITTVSERRLSTVFPRLAAASADGDRDGVPDECGAAPFRRGDADADGAVGLSDPVVILLHLFRGGAAPPCMKAADADDDGRVGLGDAVGVLRFLFVGGPAPAFPGEACGLDPTADDLACEAHAPCA